MATDEETRSLLQALRDSATHIARGRRVNGTHDVPPEARHGLRLLAYMHEDGRLTADEHASALGFLEDAIRREQGIAILNRRLSRGGSRTFYARRCEVCGWLIKNGPNVCKPCRRRLAVLEGVDPLQVSLPLVRPEGVTLAPWAVPT